MSELYDRIVSRRGRLEELIARIPGFKGYQEKQARRTADRMLRDYLSEQIDRRINRFVRLEKEAVDKIGLGFSIKMRDAKTRLQTYHDKIATAAPKYDGMWAQMKIDAADLDKIYSFDESQIRYVDQFDVAIGEVEEAIDAADKDALTDAVERLHSLASEAIDAFALRDEVLTGLSKTL
jgi:hypothetical protein